MYTLIGFLSPHVVPLPVVNATRVQFGLVCVLRPVVGAGRHEEGVDELFLLKTQKDVVRLILVHRRKNRRRHHLGANSELDLKPKKNM